MLLSMLNVPHASLIILIMFTIVVKQGRAAPKQIFHVDSVCGCSMWFSLFVNIHSLHKLLAICRIGLVNIHWKSDRSLQLGTIFDQQLVLQFLQSAAPTKLPPWLKWFYTQSKSVQPTLPFPEQYLSLPKNKE